MTNKPETAAQLLNEMNQKLNNIMRNNLIINRNLRIELPNRGIAFRKESEK
jgi:hypothetical protein